MQEIKHIIFDLGGVILNIDYNRTSNAFKNLGVEKFDALYSQARQTGIFDLYEVGKLNEDEFVDQLIRISGKELNEKDVIMAWNAMLLDFPKKRIGLLEKLKRKYQLFLLSNTNFTHKMAFEDILKRDIGETTLNKWFEKVYFSHEIGMRKPDSEIFQHVLEENKLTKENTLFIDDSIQHIDSAQSMGIKTFHLQNMDVADVFKEII